MTVDAPPRPAQAQELAVETRGLRKTYRTRKGRSVAVAGLDLKVPRGGVHGFLGPNGSGKTTTIRMLLGLITADSGEMAVLGRPVPQHLPEVIGSIGAIVEQPKFFPAFSGRRNLQLLAQAIGAPPARVDEVLTEVGLGSRGRDRFRSYSLGMRQRLAIAATLLKDPELLIFDEPTNGLDPAGIHEIRATMRGLADSGRTVLVSSHILTEVQQVADTVSIIGRGRLLAEGDVAEILARGARETVRVRVPDPARAAQLLGAAGFAVQPGPDLTLVVTPARPEGGGQPFDAATITELLARQEIFVSELVPQRADLEQVFLALTAEEHLGAGGPPPPQSPPEVLATSARPSGPSGADR
jgi:ABC-2 type transport system ATP-binding protein